MLRLSLVFSLFFLTSCEEITPPKPTTPKPYYIDVTGEWRLTQTWENSTCKKIETNVIFFSVDGIVKSFKTGDLIGQDKGGNCLYKPAGLWEFNVPVASSFTREGLELLLNGKATVIKFKKDNIKLKESYGWAGIVNYIEIKR